MLLLLLLLLASRCHPLLLHLLLLLPLLHQRRRRRRRRRRSRRKKGKRIAGGRRPKPLRAVATATPEKPPSALVLPRLLPPLRPGASCGVMLDRRHVYRGEKRVSACVCGIRDETKRKGLPSDRACQSAPRLSFFFFSLTCHYYCCCSPRRAALRPSGPGARRGWRDASKEGSGESGRGSKEQTKKIIETEITLSTTGRKKNEKKTPMLAQRVAAAPRAEALASSSSSSYGSRFRVGSLPARSRDPQRARAAPETAALMPSASAATSRVPTLLSSSRGLPQPRQAAARQSLPPRATPEDGEGSSGSGSSEDGAAEGSDDAGNADDAMPPTPPKTTAAKKTRTPALEARKADRLRSQLLSMMPDPVDDPLFDAGAGISFCFVSRREGERGRERGEVERRRRRRRRRG